MVKQTSDYNDQSEQNREPEHKPQKAKLVKRSSRGVSRKVTSLSEVVSQNGEANAIKLGLFWFTLLLIYKNLYILGITVARRWLKYRRRAKRCLLRQKGRFYARLHKIASFLALRYRRFTIKLATPLHNMQAVYEKNLPTIRAQRAQGKVLPIRAAMPIVYHVADFLWWALRKVLNYVAPVAAAVVLLVGVHSTLTGSVALRLEYNGQVLGYVQNEAVFDEATRLVRERIMEENTEGIPISVPNFVLEETDVDELLESNDIADQIVSLSGGEIEQAYGLFIDDEFYGAVTEKDGVLNELQRIKDEYKTGKPDEQVSFAKSIRFTEALYPADSLVDEAELVEQLSGNETESETYIVQSGDTPTEIADKNGMEYAELLRLNPTIEDDLKPGYELQTKVAKPLLPVQISYVTTYEETIPYSTVEVENSTYVQGYRSVTQEGEDGKRRVVAEVTVLNGVEVDRMILDNSEILVEPIDERIVVGIHDPTPSAASSNTGFIWPTSGGVATTYAGHTGNAVDIARPSGTPVYASRSGTVTKVVNGYTGYGHYIMIDHGDGYVTLYAHNSSNLVSVGEYVEQGQVIALMGRTGWATGNHVHFEIRYNGQYLSPFDYIGYTS